MSPARCTMLLHGLNIVSLHPWSVGLSLCPTRTLIEKKIQWIFVHGVEWMSYCTVQNIIVMSKTFTLPPQQIFIEFSILMLFLTVYCTLYTVQCQLDDSNPMWITNLQYFYCAHYITQKALLHEVIYFLTFYVYCIGWPPTVSIRETVSVVC